MLTSRNRPGLPTIKCPCGAEILLIPNLRLMSQAIDAHVAEHKKKLKGNPHAEAEVEQITDELIEQVLIKAFELSESGEPDPEDVEA
jgi:hypothetical protein